MSLVFVGIAPHSPLLIPTIGKDQQGELSATRDAFKSLEQELYASKPQVLIVLSSHAGMFDDAFAINTNNRLSGDFSAFGDLVTKRQWRAAATFGAKISHAACEAGTRVRLISTDVLDHGSSVPLFFLTDHLPDISVLPIGFSKGAHDAQVAFGHLLQEVISVSHQRVAVIASVDLADQGTHGVPADVKKPVHPYDEIIVELMKTGSLDHIKDIDEAVRKDANTCSFRTLLILSGIMHERVFVAQHLCYEAPFGVGYLTLDLSLP
jgi:MEMO1 family protein